MEAKQTTLTLTLPFVDFKGTDKESVEVSSYENDGLFFVRTRMGTHEVVYVCKDKNDVVVCPLPPLVDEKFFLQDMEQEQEDKFLAIHSHINKLHNALEESLNEQVKFLQSEIVCTKEVGKATYNRIGQLVQDVEELSKSIQLEAKKSTDGYVSGKALLQIIKEVKR